MSNHLIEFATQQDLGTTQSAASSLSFAMRNLFGALLLAMWMILSTLFAPFAILLAVTCGVHLTADAARATRQLVRS